MLPWLTKKRKKIGSFGLTVESDRINCAINSLVHPGSVEEITQGEVSLAGRQSFEKGLLRLRDEYDLNKFNSHWVLCGNQYQTLLIDKPNVASHEYRAAALWQIKDMIEYPVYDCVIDVFRPAEQVKAYKNKLYVIAAKKSLLTRITVLLQNLNMSPATITTQEFAIRNVLSQVKQFSDKTIAMLTFDETQYLLTIVKGVDILFSRKIVSNIVFELERSLEFFTSALKQLPVDILLLKGVSEESELNRLLDDFQTVATVVNIDKDGLSFHLDQEPVRLPAFYALGGALEQVSTGAKVHAAD